MNQQKKIEILAEKVMNWYPKDQLGWFSEEDGFEVLRSEWNPYENIEDAWNLVERIKLNWDIGFRLDGNNYIMNIFLFEQDNPEVINGSGKTAQEAICEAALKWINEASTSSEAQPSP